MIMMMRRESDGKITQMYPLAFTKAGFLKYTSRTWPDNNGSPYEAVLGALTTIDGQSCNIQHDKLNTPRDKLDRVFITCLSGRSILITYGKMSVFPNSFGSVSERIGNM
jgi:hypothetical protein